MAKNPTNADIIKEIHEMNNTLNSHNARIGSLEMWQNAEAAAKKAIEEYKRENSKGTLTQKDIFVAVLKLIGVIATLVAFIAGGSVLTK